MARRLTAILAADVVEYSRLMGKNEAGTLAALKGHRKELIDPKAAQYGGRTIKLMGDGALMEFPSVVEAITFAVEVQCAMVQRNAEIAEDKQILFRIGINVGDVIVEGDDIYGDGVNVASRLEGLAKPGGICVSRNVRDQIRDKLDLNLEDLGEVEVKNIIRPVRAFRVVLDEKAAAFVTPVVQQTTKQGRLRWPVSVAAVILLLVVAGGAFWWQPWAPDVEPASIERMAYPLPERPSIAVLAFENMSGDPEQGYFADGITESVITELSRFRNLFVIARNSTFTYKGKAVKVQQVAEDLGVQYVLEGSVQRSKDRVRINVQLIDAITGWHLWAERYDRELNDLFAVQDEVTRQIVATLATQEGRLAKAWQERTARKGTVSLKAYDLDLRGVVVQGGWTKEAFASAEELFEKAIAADPEYARPYANLAMNLVWQVYSKFAPEEALGRAVDLAKEAISRDDGEAWGHWALGAAYLKLGAHEQAVAEYERALEINPNDADVLAETSFALAWVGRAEEGIENARTAMRLNPRHPDWYLWGLGVAYYDARRYAEAVATLESRKQPNLKSNLYLAAAYAQLGRQEQAQATVQRILDETPVSSIERYGRAQPYKNETDLNHYIDGLRMAGLPEHSPLPLPDKPSIAVLPFTNMSGDPEQAYFADGMTDDLITDLSKVSGLFVIARNSVFTYKGTPVKVQEVARDLGVRYVLEGSVRRADGKVRINAQLVDATTGHHLWADRFDRDYADIFALQDEVIGRIVAALAVELTDTEQARLTRKPTENLEAYELYLRAEQGIYSYDKILLAVALSNYEKATALDPKFAEAHAGYARVAAEFLRLDQTAAMPADVARERAYESVTRALALNPELSRAHSVIAVLQLVDRQYREAIESARKAVSLDPNNAEGYANLALVLAYSGRPAEASAAMEVGLRLNPKAPAAFHLIAGEVWFIDRQYDRAIGALTAARDAFTGCAACQGGARLQLAMTYAQLDRLDEAKAEIKIALVNRQWWNLGYVRQLYAYYKRDTDLNRRLDALRKAGLPEWPLGFEGRPEDRLDGDAIKTLVFGQHWIGRSRVNFKIFAQKTGEDGEVSYLGSGTRLKGTASVEGDMLCYRFPETLMGRKVCVPVYRNPDGTLEDRNEYVAADVFDVHDFSLKQ